MCSHIFNGMLFSFLLDDALFCVFIFHEGGKCAPRGKTVHFNGHCQDVLTTGAFQEDGCAGNRVFNMYCQMSLAKKTHV